MLHDILFNTISLITILNPISAAIIMISLIKYSEIKQVSLKASITIFIASIITIFVGGRILNIFGINIPAIKAIGGVVLLIIALNMVQGKEIAPTNATKEESQAASNLEDIAIVPLAIPILFGPGVITTLIVLSEKSSTINDKISLILAIFLATIATYLTLRNASYISRFLGVNGLKIITRLMGLIIGAIAFIFLVGGVKTLWLMIK